MRWKDALSMRIRQVADKLKQANQLRDSRI
jgi:hypothetical protein